MTRYLVAVLAGALFACAANLPNLTRRAWEQRDALDVKFMLGLDCSLKPGQHFTDDGKACRAWLPRNVVEMHDPKAREDRWHHFLAEVPDMPRSENITSVSAAKTIDSGNWVFSLRDADGKVISYWLDSGDAQGGAVRTITNY